jgi:hypothetical protein
MFIVKILLVLFPFKFCLKLFSGRNCIDKDWDQYWLGSITKASQRANYLAFWNNRCLVQSLAARWMLQRRRVKSILSIGVGSDENHKFIAHAWVRVGQIEIVPRDGDYKELYTV